MKCLLVTFFNDSKQVEFLPGDTIGLKRKNGRQLMNCIIEYIFDNGFVYCRKNKKGWCYSQVLLEDLEYIHA